ncbi:helix-turn-helix domain-containing protein [Micromonospora sp. CPCC 205547]|uniref:helix-turn-helix domain-containing protein n=1 Tax=Micromonospora sp. CPCC 205547 TaxID=3122400 RepID=UPI003B96790F
MTGGGHLPEVFAPRPKRAGARRNYESLIAAAREAFAENGASASLEEVARRAGVGIGTLYRNFPSRRELFEAVYVEEVGAGQRTAGDVGSQDLRDRSVSERA